MSYSYYQENIDNYYASGDRLLRPQLPIPETFYSKMVLSTANSRFDWNYNHIDDDARIMIESFISPQVGALKSEPLLSSLLCNYNLNFNPAPYQPVNEMWSYLNTYNAVGEVHDRTTEIQTPNNSNQENNVENKGSLKSFSDIHSWDDNNTGSKVPTKEKLYQLSMMIQNTNPEFENFLSSDLHNYFNKCELTPNGLYVSKIICDFDWCFEIFFEKNRGTNRNRRQLRCKHHNCNKIFKKAWNLFDHMRIHTGEKPFICNQCGRSFAQNGNLTKHLKLHLKNDRKIHDCRVCGKKYTEKFNLRVHEKKHKLALSSCNE